MKTSEILDGAADVIERRGRHRGGPVPEHAGPSRCPVDVLAAINVSGGADPEDLLLAERGWAALAFARWVGVLGAALYCGVWVAVGREWNDAPYRTAEEVAAELRAAAASEREAGR